MTPSVIPSARAFIARSSQLIDHLALASHEGGESLVHSSCPPPPRPPYALLSLSAMVPTVGTTQDISDQMQPATADGVIGDSVPTPARYPRSLALLGNCGSEGANKRLAFESRQGSRSPNGPSSNMSGSERIGGTLK